MTRLKTGILIATLSGFAAPAFAADTYVSGSIGRFNQDSSSNDGRFLSNFTTGAVTGVTPPLTIPSGSPVGWTTDFDDDTTYSLAFGWKRDAVRVEIEYSSTDSDIKSHQGVSAAGIDLTSIDAGVLLTGNVGDLGVTVGQLVADGRGSIETTALFVNALYDFLHKDRFSPYIGLGLGWAEAEVNFAPSGVGVIDDQFGGFAYQFILGASYAVNDNVEVFGNFRLREFGDAEVQSPLLISDFDVENSGTSFDLGIRYHF